MPTHTDGDGTLWQGNYIMDNLMPLLDRKDRLSVTSVYIEYSAACHKAAKRARTVDELIENVSVAERRYMQNGAMLLQGKPVSTLTSGVHKPNKTVMDVAYRSVNNGGLIIMSAEDERTADSFAASVGLKGYSKVCSRLVEENGVLTGAFDKIVTARVKADAYKGGNVYENGINGVGVIVNAINAGYEANVCGNDEILKEALITLNLIKRVKFISKPF